MTDLIERKNFGTVVGKVWVVEFQKRGLSHSHILIILDEAFKLCTTQDINSAVSAKIPDPAIHPDAYETVTRCLVHGPCGIDNPNAPCMENGNAKSASKVCDWDSTDHDGYPVYRRRDDGRYFEDSRRRRVDNRWIVPHNLYLSSTYNAHINVEVSWRRTTCTSYKQQNYIDSRLYFMQICSSISAIKYLFKYVYKGHDRATVMVRDVKEIQQYIDARYISAPEACWRILGFRMHDHSPPIQRLQVHLSHQQQVAFYGDGNLVDAVSNVRACKMTRKQWFELTRTNVLARDTTYLNFPSHFVWTILKNNGRRKSGKCAYSVFTLEAPKLPISRSSTS